MTRILIPAALVAALTTATAQVQAQATSTPQAGATVAPQANAPSNGAQTFDALFAQAAAASGLGEVAIGEIGQKKATDPRLQEFSRMVVADHTKVNKDLMALASQKGIALPADFDARSKFALESLSGAPKEEFDACYVKIQMAIHLEAIAAFEAEVKHGKDQDIKALAKQALPKIKQHLHTLQPIFKEMERAHEDEADKSNS